jgi:HK97 family phage major capsid protein
MSRSIELREQALAKLTEARALADPSTGLPSAENEEAFNAAMEAFGDLDRQRAQADTTEGNATTAVDAWKHYSAALTGEEMRFSSTTVDPKSRKSPGEQFVESSAFRALLEQPDLEVPGSAIRTGPIVVGQRRNTRMGAAAGDLIDTESGGSTAFTQYRLPGVLPLAQRPLTVRDLFPNEDMPSGDSIEYVAQVGFDSAAAAVSQATAVNGSGVTGGVKPQSSIRLEERTARATWIATWMAVTRQALSDITQLRALIDNQGTIMIRLAEEDQFLNGTGTAPQLIGILDDDNTGLQTLDLTGLGALDNLEGIRTARRLARTGVGRIPPTFVVVHPIDSEEFDLLKDNEGRYRAGDPFATGGPDSPPIWRLPRVESEAITEGTALVGGRAGATIFDREPLTIRVAEQHSDFFIRNLAVVLFEERVAFPIYFPGAFVEVTLSDWDIVST